VHAALAYYYEHRSQVDAAIREGEQFIEQMQAQAALVQEYSPVWLSMWIHCPYWLSYMLIFNRTIERNGISQCVNSDFIHWYTICTLMTNGTRLPIWAEGKPRNSDCRAAL
jgi:hypothetical protein